MITTLRSSKCAPFFTGTKGELCQLERALVGVGSATINVLSRSHHSIMEFMLKCTITMSHHNEGTSSTSSSWAGSWLVPRCTFTLTRTTCSFSVIRSGICCHHGTQRCLECQRWITCEMQRRGGSNPTSALSGKYNINI